MPPERSNNLVFLDSLRGFAALYVAIGHARWLLWEGYSGGYTKHPELYNAFEKLSIYFFSLFKFGHEAVLFFFVLSGFVIHLKQAKALKLGTLQFNYTDYLKRRFFRIYPPFLFAILLTFVLDILGYSLGFTIYTNNTLNTVINHSVLCDIRLENLLTNLVFWKTTTTSTFGTNGPLWSLKYEWWFYMIYPFLLLLSTKIGYMKTLVLIIVMSLSAILIEPMALSFPINIVGYLLSWWFGVVLADIYTKRIDINPILFAPLTLIVAILSMKINMASDILFDTFWALSFFGLLNFFFFLQTKGIHFSFLNRFKWLGDCSYTLYVTHFPILVFINGIVLYYNANQLPMTQIFIPLATLFCLVCAYRLHFFTEKKTNQTLLITFNKQVKA
jgi:peptidoglycan/LPS O-acetylase OafA/YrhL